MWVSTGTSFAVETRVPKILVRSFLPGGTVDISCMNREKETAFAQQLGVSMLLADLSQQVWQVARAGATGYHVYAPTLDGCGERRDQVRRGITVATHAGEVAGFLFYEDLRDVVLVGTSSGGMVVCKAAELAAERIARLVFVDALALLPGERVADIVNRPAANEVTALTTAPSRQDAEGRMFAGLEPAPLAWTLARYTPHPVAALEAPMELGDFWEHPWPASVIRCRQARNPPESHQRRTAERLKAAYTGMDTGHNPMLSRPDELVRLLTF